MTAQIIVLADHRKPQPKELTYAEWLDFCFDPWGFLRMERQIAQLERAAREGQFPGGIDDMGL